MEQETEKYRRICRNMRLDIIELCHRSGEGKAHLGGCMSLVEILAVLYSDVLYLGDLSVIDDKRDRLILSKGHGAIALYAALRQAGRISAEEMGLPIRGENTFLYRHPKKNLERGIEISSGSLGLGLPYGIGVAYGLKKKYGKDAPNVFVILGDGECNEGVVWESAGLAGHLRLGNLTVIIDKNGLQLDGATKDILNMDSLSEKWHAFGFDTFETDGHDCVKLLEIFKINAPRPKAVIAETIKGKGVSFAENITEWHDGYLTDELYEIAKSDVMRFDK